MGRYYVTKEQLRELANAENGNQICVLCLKIAREQRLQTERRESLTKGLATSLLIFARSYTGKPLKLQDVPLTKNQYSNFQKLRYFELVDNPDTGMWTITDKGWYFLHGGPVSKHVTVDMNQTVGFSDTKVTIDTLTGAYYQKRHDYL